MFQKTYDAATIEPRVRAAWEAADAFRAGAGAPDGAEPFCIVIPPPNVTGSLHMGHALNNTLQDILVRFERMRGKNVLWQPGTDHAGIATQMVVERQLAETGNVDRQTLGRAEFVRRVWQWKEASGGAIKSQLDRLGASCDWSRERFTMDEGLSDAVLTVFVQLYKQGLIYRDKRLVNWDPKLRTAISDLEVEFREITGELVHLRYPLVDVRFDASDPTTYIVVATTRPETMLGDTAVAVHPDDARYTKLVGRHVTLPLVGRRIPIVADPYSDPDKGSGAVKITPAHDFNDFEVGRRHNLALITVFDQDATVRLKSNAAFLAGLRDDNLSALLEDLEGLDRSEARRRVVDRLTQHGFVERREAYTHQVPFGDRSGVAIEPLLTDQWYVNAKQLAGPAISAVREGRTSFVPASWSKTYFDWMENIQPWCISRQLWWGHQIPAWYGPDGKLFVERTETDVRRVAELHYGRPVDFKERDDAISAWACVEENRSSVALYREQDVLDTWFSSALWPFSTLGWPYPTNDLQQYYPTTVLSTGFDIIFFWVARMMMMGIHFLDDVPFQTVYVHALVRDEDGAKMSKSKGNVVDPLDLIDEFGADALRFTLAAMAAQGRDVKIARNRVQGYRNFATKLWNATRFAYLNECRIDPSFTPKGTREVLTRWILTETSRTSEKVANALQGYRFNEAADAIYSYTWNTFCDWYLELAKPILSSGPGAAREEIRATTAFVLGSIFKILHPFMPFVTEELWRITMQRAQLAQDSLLIHSKWPGSSFVDDAAAEEINFVIDIVSAVRSLRAEANVPAAREAEIVVVGASDRLERWLGNHQAAIKRLARANGVAVADVAPHNSAQSVVGEAVVCLPLAELVDLEGERRRLTKEAARVEKELAKINGRLSNSRFLEMAELETVEEQRAKRKEAEVRLAKVRAALGRLDPAA